jgi:hypothetical protein
MALTAIGALRYLDAVNPVKIIAHTAAPNATGTTNRIGSLLACTFAAASGTSRTLSADVPVTIPAGVTSATHFSLYNAADECLHIQALNTPRTGLIEGDTLNLKASGPDAISVTIS